jgi:hypothetical protein
LVIEAVAKRYQDLNNDEKVKFFFRILPEIKQIETNINFSELFFLGQKANALKFKGVVLDFSTNLLEGATTTIGASTAYILIPKEGLNNYGGIRQFITSQINN